MSLQGEIANILVQARKKKAVQWGVEAWRMIAVIILFIAIHQAFLI